MRREPDFMGAARAAAYTDTILICRQLRIYRPFIRNQSIVRLHKNTLLAYHTHISMLYFVNIYHHSYI